MCPAISSQTLPSHGSVSDENTRMKPKARTNAGSATGNWYKTRANARTRGLRARKTAYESGSPIATHEIHVITATNRLAENARRKLGSAATSRYHLKVAPVGRSVL